MYELNPNLRDFWTTPKPYKRLKGGRFSGKTQDAGGMAVFLARNYSLKFLCIRQFQNRISESVYTVLKEKIDKAGWNDEFIITNNSIRHNTTGSEFIFYGIARNIAEIKGTEGVDVCWIEEAEGLTELQWEYIDPTIRKEGSEIWMLWNPRLTTDFVENKLPKILGNDCVTRHINYDENDFLSDTARMKAERLKETDPDGYEHIYLGVARSDNDKAIIKLSWIEAAVDAHIKLDMDFTGSCHIGYDVADSGGDRNCATRFNGSFAEHLESWYAAEDELDVSSLRAYSLMNGSGTMAYDSIGVGAGVGALLKNAGKKNYSKFNAAGEVFNPDKEYSPKITNKKKFENLKAQAWRDVADRLMNTYNAVTKGHSFDASDMISISSDLADLEDLKIELCTPHSDYSKRGLDMVESKKDVTKRLGVSHDLADSFIIAACPHLVKTQRKRFTIHG